MQIKSVTTYRSDNSNPEDSYKNSFILYNRNGDVVEATDWTENGDVESRIITNYNESFKIIEEINYISDTEISEQAIYSRNDDGSIKSIEINYADGSKTIKHFTHHDDNSRTITFYNEDGEFDGSEFYRFNNDGNIIEKTVMNFNNNLEEKTLIYYNEKGKIVKEDQINEYDKVISSRNYVYDDNYNVIEIITTNENNKITERVLTKFDNKNRITEQKVKDSYLVKFSYDDESNTKTEERFSPGEQLNYILTTFFDESGLITEEQALLYTTKYKYDYFD